MAASGFVLIPASPLAHQGPIEDMDGLWHHDVVDSEPEELLATEKDRLVDLHVLLLVRHDRAGGLSDDLGARMHLEQIIDLGPLAVQAVPARSFVGNFDFEDPRNAILPNFVLLFCRGFALHVAHHDGLVEIIFNQEIWVNHEAGDRRVHFWEA